MTTLPSHTQALALLAAWQAERTERDLLRLAAEADRKINTTREARK